MGVGMVDGDGERANGGRLANWVIARCGWYSEKRQCQADAEGGVQGLVRRSHFQRHRGSVYTLSATAEGAGG